MQFLKKHQGEVDRAIESAGHSRQDFQFVKRKGRIRTIYTKNDRVYSYFRVKETRINSKTGKFENSDHYLISQDGSKERKVKDWDEVMEGMKEWLVGL